MLIPLSLGAVVLARSRAAAALALSRGGTVLALSRGAAVLALSLVVALPLAAARPLTEPDEPSGRALVEPAAASGRSLLVVAVSAPAGGLLAWTSDGFGLPLLIEPLVLPCGLVESLGVVFCAVIGSFRGLADSLGATGCAAVERAGSD